MYLYLCCCVCPLLSSQDIAKNAHHTPAQKEIGWPMSKGFGLSHEDASTCHVCTVSWLELAFSWHGATRGPHMLQVTVHMGTSATPQAFVQPCSLPAVPVL